MKPAARRTVQVRIQGRAYKIRAEGEGDAAGVHRAASLLDETIERVRVRAGTVDSVDVAVLAGLNIANTLVSAREARVAPELAGERVAGLIALVESALAGGMESR